MFNYLCTLKYNGRNFCGWVKQQKAKTVQGTIEAAIKKITKQDNFKTLGASKTDAGVHAEDQKMLLVLDFAPNMVGFLASLNANVLPDIFISSMTLVDDEFRIRNCQFKEYQYRINLGEYRLYENDFEWSIKRKFDVEKYETAIKTFIGTHNFSNFSGLTKEEMLTINVIRNVDIIEVNYLNNILITTFQAKGFVRYQIRRMVGAAVGYATGRIKNIQEIIDVLELKQEKFNLMADPKGLVLKKIVY